MALINQAFKVEAFFIVRDRLTPEETLAYFKKGRFLVAEENGALAGVVYVELRGDAATSACSPSSLPCKRAASAAA